MAPNPEEHKANQLIFYMDQCIHSATAMKCKIVKSQSLEQLLMALAKDSPFALDAILRTVIEECACQQQAIEALDEKDKQGGPQDRPSPAKRAKFTHLRMRSPSPQHQRQYENLSQDVVHHKRDVSLVSRNSSIESSPQSDSYFKRNTSQESSEPLSFRPDIQSDNSSEVEASDDDVAANGSI